MDTFPLIAFVLACATGVYWLTNVIRFARSARDVPSLDARTHPHPPKAPVRISVIVAAKDEEKNIERCVRSILSQDYPDFEVIVVNDRSTDATAKILTKLESEAAGRLRAIHVEVLPDGWGGQNHAIRQGVLASKGEWFCFTDADCHWESPRALSTAWNERASRGAELLSIFPRMEVATAWERIYLPVCLLAFMMRQNIGDVNHPDRAAAYANGAFMLVRRATYESLGGHERVRNQLNDDIALAQIAKRDGVPIRVASNTDLYSTRMYGSLVQAWNGWTRNFYGTLQSRSNLLALFATVLALFAIPWPAFLVCVQFAVFHAAEWWIPSIAWGAVVAFSHAVMWTMYPRCDCPRRGSIAYYAGAVFVTAVVARAAARSVMRTGTHWQGAHYAADQRAPADRPKA